MNVLVILRKILFPAQEDILRLFRRLPLTKGVGGDVVWWSVWAACVALSLAIIWLGKG
jgi:hypothetical protein